MTSPNIFFIFCHFVVYKHQTYGNIIVQNLAMKNKILAAQHRLSSNVIGTNDCDKKKKPKRKLTETLAESVEKR